jgi:uncharacterized protein (TIGR03086 family)
VTAQAATPSPGPAHHRLAQAIRYADGVLDAVTPRLLSEPTPCHAWNLRMLLEHTGESLVALHEGVTAGLVAASAAQTGAPADGASSAAAAVSVFREHATALLHASAQADGEVPVTIGGHPIPLDIPLDCLRTAGALEIAVHAWDISEACGQHLSIPDELATDLMAHALLLVPRLGRHPLFAAPAPVPPRSASCVRLIAYLGRPTVVPPASA